MGVVRRSPNSRRTAHLVLSPSPELTEAELEMATGGLSVIGTWN